MYAHKQLRMNIQLHVHLFAGESCRQFCAQHGRTQRHNHVTDGMLWIHRLLVPQPDPILSRFHRIPHRLRKLVLPFTSHQFDCETTSFVYHVVQLARSSYSFDIGYSFSLFSGSRPTLSNQAWVLFHFDLLCYRLTGGSWSTWPSQKATYFTHWHVARYELLARLWTGSTTLQPLVRVLYVSVLSTKFSKPFDTLVLRMFWDPQQKYARFN